LKPEAAQIIEELGVSLRVHKGVAGVDPTCAKHVTGVDTAEGCLA